MKLVLETVEDVTVRQGFEFQAMALIFTIEDNSATLRSRRTDSNGGRYGQSTLSVKDAGVLDGLINNSTSFSDIKNRIYSRLQNKYSGTIVNDD